MEYNRYRLTYGGGGNGGKLELAEILPFKSLVWEESYNGIGKMQAVFPKTLANVQSIVVGGFAGIQGAGTMMYVHAVKVTDTEIWAYGYEAKALLQKQGMMPYEELQTERPVNESIALAWDNFNELTYCDYDYVQIPTLSAKSLAALEYWSLYDFIRQACALEGAGYRLKFLENTGKLHLDVWKGQDVSAVVRFATAFGNANGVAYSLDDQSEIFEVVAVGNDDGSTVYAHATGSVTPIERTKAFLDLRLEFPKPEDMTSADYLSALQTRAQMSQIARSKRQKLEIKNVDVSDFGVTFGLGDIVGVEIPEYSLSLKARVATLRRTIEGNRDTLTLDLSTAL